MNYVSRQVAVAVEDYRCATVTVFPLRRPAGPPDAVTRRLLAAVTEAFAPPDRPPGGAPPVARTTTSGLAPWQVRKVSQYIDTELAHHISVASLAGIARLSASHFSRAFKISCGAAPANYVTSRRLESAKRLMLSTDKPLCQISLDCGFADQAHLSRVFRRWTGETPRAWRRAHKQA
jgi:transcriptional regulator GlxA family with amidase domain